MTLTEDSVKKTIDTLCYWKFEIINRTYLVVPCNQLLSLGVLLTKYSYSEV